MAIRPIWQAQAAKRLDEAMHRGGVRSAAAARALKAAGLKGGPSMVSLWRSGKRVPDVDQFVALLKLCGGSADEVLGLGGQVSDELVRLRAKVEKGRSALGDGGDDVRLAEEALLARERRPGKLRRQR